MGTLYPNSVRGEGGTLLGWTLFTTTPDRRAPKQMVMEVWTFVLATAVAVADPGRGGGGGGGGGGEGTAH